MPDAVFPSRRDEAAAPAGSALPVLALDQYAKGHPAGPSLLRRTRRPAETERRSDYSVISWILAVSWGLGGPVCKAIALVMSPWSLILPAMKACIAACGLASTIIALAVP